MIRLARRFARSSPRSKILGNLRIRPKPLPVLEDCETIVGAVGDRRSGHDASAGSLVKLGDVSKFRL